MEALKCQEGGQRAFVAGTLSGSSVALCVNPPQSAPAWA